MKHSYNGIAHPVDISFKEAVQKGFQLPTSSVYCRDGKRFGFRLEALSDETNETAMLRWVIPDNYKSDPRALIRAW